MEQGAVFHDYFSVIGHGGERRSTYIQLPGKGVVYVKYEKCELSTSSHTQRPYETIRNKPHLEDIGRVKQYVYSDFYAKRYWSHW